MYSVSLPPLDGMNSAARDGTETRLRTEHFVLEYTYRLNILHQNIQPRFIFTGIFLLTEHCTGMFVPTDHFVLNIPTD